MRATLPRPVLLRPVLVRTAALGLMAGLAACGGGDRERRADVEILGTNPNADASAVAAAEPTAPVGPVAQPDASGVVDYGSYQTAVAHQGDTVADLAARIGLSASELGAYNGLTPSHTLREGDELVLPPRPGGYAGTAVATAAPDVTPADPTVFTDVAS
ncbi:MAG TPA: LysM domain-containing protein, partial [Paracoccaceae bacterium]|nr:LysM domain-containing protein [Paracoccaceae bacterium]